MLGPGRASPSNHPACWDLLPIWGLCCKFQHASILLLNSLMLKIRNRNGIGKAFMQLSCHPRVLTMCDQLLPFPPPHDYHCLLSIGFEDVWPVYQHLHMLQHMLNQSPFPSPVSVLALHPIPPFIFRPKSLNMCGQCTNMNICYNTCSKSVSVSLSPVSLSLSFVPRL